MSYYNIDDDENIMYTDFWQALTNIQYKRK